MARQEMKQGATSPVTYTPDLAAANYDRLSRWYDLLAGSSERRAIRVGFELLAVREGETVLEIGYGTGRTLVDLARAAGAGGRVAGIDLSDGMTAVTRRRLHETGLTSRVSLVRGDATHLPFGQTTFDAVFTSFVLELLPVEAILAVLRGAREVLRPEGRFCTANLAQSRRGGFTYRLYGATHKRFPTLLDCRPIPIERMVEDSGLRVTGRRRMSMWGMPVDVVLARAP